MRGLLLAGGTGSRLAPLTSIVNKHLLPVGNRPMLQHPLEKMVEAGITDIMIVTGRDHAGSIINYFGSGIDFGCDITYRVQEDADGIAGALSLAEGFVRSKICVILGDNMFSGDLRPILVDAQQPARIVLYKPDAPEDLPRFGVATIVSKDELILVEKPPLEHLKKYDESLSNSYIITGLYVYDTSVFSFIKNLKKSWRGEYEITDINKAYLNFGQLDYINLNGWWTDAGTFSSYKKANSFAKFTKS